MCVPRAGDVDAVGVYIGPHPRMVLGVSFWCRFFLFTIVAFVLVVPVVHVASVTDPVAYADAPFSFLPFSVLGGDFKSFGGVWAGSELLSKLLWIRNFWPICWSQLVLDFQHVPFGVVHSLCQSDGSHWWSTVLSFGICSAWWSKVLRA